MALKQTVITENMPFNVVVPVLKQATTSNNDNSTYIEGMSSNTEKSATRHKMTTEAIQQMKEQATGLPIFLNHDSNVVVGNIVETLRSSPEEFWVRGKLLDLSGNDVVDAPVLQVIHWLDQNVQLGMSVGGSVLKAAYIEDEENNDWWIEIQSIKLHEDSITPIPAVEETKGKLKKCNGSVCNQIATQIYQTIKQNPKSDAHTIVDNVRIEEKKETTEVSEENTMAEQETVTISKKEYDGLKQTLDFLKEKADAEIAEAKKLQKEAELETLKQTIKAEIKQEFDEELKSKEKEWEDGAVEALKQVMEDKAKFLVNNRESAQPSEVTPEPIAQTTVPTVEPDKLTVEQKLKSSVNYPASVNGTFVQSYDTDVLAKQLGVI